MARAPSGGLDDEPGPRGQGLGEIPRPEVSGSGAGGGRWLIGGGAVLMGLIAFLWLSAHRAHPPAATAAQLGPGAAAAITAPPPPPALAALEDQSRGLQNAPSALPPGQALVTPPPAMLAGPAAAPPPTSGEASRAVRTPVLVVDLSRGSESAAATPALGGAAAADGNVRQRTDAAGASALNANEQFLARVEGGQPARASATMLRHQGNLIAQGTVIPAVLETALDSDLPGYARAVISRDVRSFDASTILIPRGSQVIGEYRSAAAQGQTRAFVIWTRILRPDGGSIMIGSGGGDPLGRAGLGGKVDTHFLERFSGAILLTALEAGASKLAGTPSTQVVIGTGASAAGGLAAPLSALAPANIPPTIKVAQGTPLLIFVQRDLDFTPVEAAAR